MALFSLMACRCCQLEVLVAHRERGSSTWGFPEQDVVPSFCFAERSCAHAVLGACRAKHICNMALRPGSVAATLQAAKSRRPRFRV